MWGMQSLPPVLCTFKTLSLPPESCWKAEIRGADTENNAHCAYVGELAAGPECAGELMTPW
jgi:hypothetical protein